MSGQSARMTGSTMQKIPMMVFIAVLIFDCYTFNFLIGGAIYAQFIIV